MGLSATGIALGSKGTTAPIATTASCSSADFDADRARLHTVDLKQDGVARRYYLFQSDNLVAANDLRPLWQRSCERQKTLAPRKRGPSVELNISLDDQGRRVIWPRNRRALSYAIERDSFPNEPGVPPEKTKYGLVVTAMKEATADWVAVCPQCGITFDYRSVLDDGSAKIATGVPGPGEVTFIVTYLPSETEFIAASFFPNDLPYKHRLYLTPDFYTSEFDRAGVFRHEIGHILGYRHEHLGISGCPSETGAWASVGGYTRDSVMHYLCGGGGTTDLLIVGKDKVQHRIVYLGA
jgi:predicted Zn-dependent protease